MKAITKGLWGCITVICIIVAIANHNGVDTGVKTSDILPAWIGFSALCLALPIGIFIIFMIAIAGLIGVAVTR